MDNWEGRGKTGEGGNRGGCRADLESTAIISVKRPAASLVVILHSVKDCYGLKSVSPRKISEVLTPSIPETSFIWKPRVAVDIVIQDRVVLEKVHP